MTKKKKTLKDDAGYPEGEVDAVSNGEALTAEEISEKYTVAELRYILRENGLKVSGNKKELVERVLPILNGESSETLDEEVDEPELTENAKTFEVKKVILAETEDSGSEDDDLSFQDNVESLSSSLSFFGINYDELPIKDETIMDDNVNLSVKGFIRNGLSMSDYTMSIEDASDSSNANLKLNIPEVAYSDFNSTIFSFRDLDLSILPSSNPQSLEFSAILDSLEIITDTNYVNLKGLNLLFKSFSNEGVRLDIDIDHFIFPYFNDTSVNFDDLDFNLSIGMDGQSLVVSVNLPALNLINKEYRVKSSDLSLNVAVPDLNLSNLDLSIVMPDFHYTNFDDVHIDMDNLIVSIEPILDSSSVNVLIRLDGFDATGLNSFDDLFPMLDITEIHFKNPTSDSESLINLIGRMSLLDVTKLDLSYIGALLSLGFDVDTYTRNMPNKYESNLDDAIDISSTEVSDSDNSGFDLGSVFANCDYSGLDTIVLDLTGLLDSLAIDLSDLGIDVSDYDLSAISLSDVIDSLSDSDFVKSAIAAISKLFSIDFGALDTSSLIVSFDSDNFDISGLLASLNLSESDIVGIIDMFNDSDVDFAGIFENCDYSCLGAIVLDLSGLLDSLGIDLSDLGVDVSDYDLSAISLSEVIGILGNFDFDMSTISVLLKLFGLDLDDVDLSGLIASFDSDNFDLSSLLASLNISGTDIAGILDMFNDSDVDFAGIFENCDYSCLGAIVLDLTGLIDSLGIDLSDLGLELDDVDLSAISLSEVIGILGNFDFDMSTISALLKLFGLDLDDVDLSGLIASFDSDNFDLSSLLASLNLSDLDISAISEMFNDSDVDFAGVFENCDYSSLDGIVLDLTGLLDSADIDLSEFGIDVSECDLSAISLPDVIGILSNSDFDISELDLSSIDFDGLDLSGLIASFDSDNFDLSSLLASLNLSDLDIAGIIDMFNDSDVDLGSVFENCDYSCLGAIVLDLSGLIDSLGIDLSDLGLELDDVDLSAISLSEVIGILGNLNLDMSTISALLKLFGLDLDDVDLSGLIASFDSDNFDLSSLLASLNLSDLDISAIADMFNGSGFDLGGVFENCDYSCLGAIVLDLSGLIDSLGIDLSDLGLELDDVDLSAISLSEVIGILGNLNLDMSTISVLLKLFGLDLDDVDLSGLIASFDSDNFDLSSLLASLNLSDLNISGIADMFNGSDVDFAGVFENCDYSCLGAIVLDLSGLLDSADIDLSEFGIDVSDYDLSAISLSDVIDILCNSDFIKSAVAVISKLFDLDWDNLDMSGLIASFDADNFDLSGLLDSLDLSGIDTSGILGMFDMEGFDLTELLNNFVIMFMGNAVSEDTCAYELICQSNSFNLESLNKLFDMTFINGQLKVCIDDELVFEGDTTDDLAQEIFEITDKYLGEHEITAEFTDCEEKSNDYKEKIVVE